ncbi:DUF1750-domain-containing protein [Polychaeton citri CBS 116435]|uniref:DUF1750-domain-containing protein n=1 Tax=Polychaeton citri CBS 116435 TaxID=1314669 RepID=A0A9P4QEM8_9PEZI|nr:DUF1750-domain-containing protein [Polychaeton citri CBS 116435]
MQDPSQGVAGPLQNHVHLISGHRFPMIQSLPINQVFKYLIDAPTLVKQIAPMSWQYLTAPPEGTIWLEWIPQHKSNQQFASDGYVWADPETTYRENLGGFEIEILVHSSGYRPGQDQISCHARTRYHFVRKEPHVAAAPPDPSLWVVHYHRAEQNRHIPVSQVPMTPPVQHILSQRKWLESQGRLERKDFMLHDREHWPAINVPIAPHPSQPMQHPMPRQYFPAGAGQPPAKRQRQSGPNPIPPAVEPPMDLSLEEEENTAFGDYFDHITPRDISTYRYAQHHRWMEEVFSSPYASGQIVPIDLGLGLMGALKGLTEGILEPPSLDMLDQKDKPLKAREATPFTDLKQEQIDEFNKRIQKHLEDGRAEIEKMKADHVKKMQEWKATKKLTEAERKLRYAKWEDQGDAPSMFRVEEPTANGHANGNTEPKQTVEEIVRSVEKDLKVKIEHQDDAKTIEKGGLEREERPLREPSALPEQTIDQQMVEGQQANSNGPQPPLPTDAQSQPTQLLQESLPQDSLPFTVSQPSLATPPQQAPTQPPQPDQSNNNQPSGSLGGDSAAQTPGLDDMNMDIDNSAFDFDHEMAAHGSDNPTPQTTGATPAHQSDSKPEQPQQQQQQQSPAHAPAAPQEQQQLPQQAQPPPPSTSTVQPAIAPPSASMESAGPSNNGTAGEHTNTSNNSAANPTETADTNMFNDDNTFGDLADFGADDGLVDFDGGLGMDNAFGDAIQGMDTPSAEGGGNGSGNEGAGANASAS